MRRVDPLEVAKRPMGGAVSRDGNDSETPDDGARPGVFAAVRGLSGISS